MINNNTVPPKNRPEWKKMINGQIQHKYKNYVLQTKIHQMRTEIKEGKRSEESAIDEIYDLCSKYALAVQNDFKEVFGTW